MAAHGGMLLGKTSARQLSRTAGHGDNGTSGHQDEGKTGHLGGGDPVQGRGHGHEHVPREAYQV